MGSSNKQWINTVFVSVNLAIVLVELALNRIILSSRRWVNFPYFSICYLLFICCSEKINNGKLIYEKVGFLTLKAEELPKIITLLMIHFGFHYFGCLLVSLKQ